jgi:hypothetical protein
VWEEANVSPKEQSEAVVLLNKWRSALWARMGTGLTTEELELLAKTEDFLRLELEPESHGQRRS